MCARLWEKCTKGPRVDLMDSSRRLNGRLQTCTAQKTLYASFLLLLTSVRAYMLPNGHGKGVNVFQQVGIAKDRHECPICCLVMIYFIHGPLSTTTDVLTCSGLKGQMICFNKQSSKKE